MAVRARTHADTEQGSIEILINIPFCSLDKCITFIEELIFHAFQGITSQAA